MIEVRTEHEIRRDLQQNEKAIDAIVYAVTEGRMRPTRGWSMGVRALHDRRDRLNEELDQMTAGLARRDEGGE